MVDSHLRRWRTIVMISAIVSFVGIEPLMSQPPGFPGGGPGGGFSGLPQPPAPPGGFGGGPAMPGAGFSGRPGGFTGGGFTPGGPGGGFPGAGGGDRWEFVCSKCGSKVGSGNFLGDKQMIANCPNCGTRFGNTMAGRMADQQDRVNRITGGNGWDNRVGGPPPVGGGPGTGFAPNTPQAPALGGGFVPPTDPAPNNDISSPTPNGSSSPPTNSPTPSVTRRATLPILIIFVVGGLLFLLAIAGIGAVVWMISTAPGSGSSREEPKRRPKRGDYKPV